MYTGCITCWCPCITFGQIAEIIDRGSSCKSPERRICSSDVHLVIEKEKKENRKMEVAEVNVILCYFFTYVNAACVVSGALYMFLLCATGCSCLYSCFYRSKMRGQYLLEESPCGDCIVHCCCEPCAMCQEHRELRSRGFDMSIGWSSLSLSNKHWPAMNSLKLRW